MSSIQSSERIIFSSTPHLAGVQMLIVDNAGPRVWKAYHETFTTCVVLGSQSGSAEWVYRGKTHVAGVGGMQFMEPGETHANKKPVDGASFRVLLISVPMMKTAMAELVGRESKIHFKTAQTVDPKFFAAFRGLHFSTESNASMLEQQTRFAACLKLLAQNCLEPPVSRRVPQVHSSGIRRAKEYLHQSFRRNVGLQELASVAGISQFHFARSFKREVGLAPHEFQVQLRLSSARELLRKGFSIAHAAEESGFSDQSHFSRHFKKSWGITPHAYADCVRPVSVLFSDNRRRTR